jgi:hypothetical protein
MKVIEGNLVLKENTTFAEDLKVKGNIVCEGGDWDLNCLNLNCWDLNCRNLNCLNLNCGDLDCLNLNCWDLDCGDLNCLNLNCEDLNCRNLDCRDLDCCNKDNNVLRVADIIKKNINKITADLKEAEEKLKQ